LTLPAVGASGRAAQGLPPVKGFLEENASNTNTTGTFSSVVEEVLVPTCYESGNEVLLTWEIQSPAVTSITLEIDHGGILGAETHVLPAGQTSFTDSNFRPGVTGYLLTPFTLGSEMKSSACYIRRGAQPGSVTQFLRGDISNDGQLDLADAIFSLEAVFLGAPVACKDAADWNDDGQHDISDPIATLSYIFASGLAPAAPYPACGTDPVFDSLNCESSSICP